MSPASTAGDQTEQRRGLTAQAEAAIDAGVRAHVAQVLQALRRSPAAKTLAVLAGGIVIVVLLAVYGQIWLNRWNKPFFDALSRRDLDDFVTQLGVFFLIAGALLVLNVAERWLVETLKLRMREGLVEDLTEHWMTPRRAFWLAHTGSIGVNPDQRMHEDANKLCELSSSLSVGLLRASIAFVSFAGVLWGLSRGFTIPIAGRDYAVPGYMVWAAILYAGAGSALSYFVGSNLIRRNAERYAREADLRYSLVRINEHLDGISLASGEADERRRVRIDLAAVVNAMRLLVRSHTNLTWVTAGFGWITNVFPVLAAAPLYFTGKISFGGLIMAAAAFTHVEVSLRWYVDQFGTLADWRATLLRVASFRQALTTIDPEHDPDSHINYADGEPGRLRIQNLEVQAPGGRDQLQERDLVLTAGERVLIVAGPGAETTPLFRALAGLWPWGSGRIERPHGERILYVPRGTPYLPRGPLRAVLAYPLSVEDFADSAFAHALKRLGLDRLVPLIDETRRWESELSQDEQLSLAFARLVLQTPPWVLIDDAFGALSEEALGRFVDVLSSELGHSSIIHIGRAVEGRDPMFSRVLHFVRMRAVADERPGAAAGSPAEPDPTPGPEPGPEPR
ncbi:MAG: ABC transporter ATP-binding protein/permease [Sinimarinibacterium sp.]|jgi:putative ATP-binding cassette transporter